MKNLGFLSLFILLIFSACRKDIDMVTVTEEIPNPEIIEGYQPLIEIINGDLIGQVIDAEGAPIADAVVKMGNNTTTTDIYGHFFFNEIDMNSKGQYLTIEKEGFFLGSRRFFPQEGAKSRVRVEMLNKTFNHSFNTDNPETVSFDLVSIDFPANGIVNEDGTAYNGNVSVAAKWLNPNSNRVYDQMPGNLQGVNTTSEEVSLKTLGMIAVELQGENGEKLNIMEGAAASFTYTLPDGLLGDVPTEIPLWSFNEEVGIWVEEGVATMGPDGATYTGEFTHFSFWNWDIPVENAYFSVTFQDQNGNPLYNLMVTIDATYGTGYGYTDEQGYVAGYVPANEVLTLNVWAAFGCNNSFFTMDIGPFDADTDLGVIVIEDTSVNATSVSGTLVNCDGNSISGVVIITLDGYNWYNYTEADGNFDFYLNNCSEFGGMSLVGYDFDAGWTSNTLSLTPNTDNEVGQVVACDNDISNNILTFNALGDTWSYPILANNSADGLFIQVLEQDSVEIFFFINQEEVAIGPIESGGILEIFQNSNTNPEWFLFSNPDMPYFDELEITELTDIHVAGTFSFTAYTDPNLSGTTLVEGSFSAAFQ